MTASAQPKVATRIAAQRYAQARAEALPDGYTLRLRRLPTACDEPHCYPIEAVFPTFHVSIGWIPQGEINRLSLRDSLPVGASVPVTWVFDQTQPEIYLHMEAAANEQA